MPARSDRSRRESLRRHARELRRLGYRRIAGVDEAGVGPLAGPLVAAAVVLPAGARLPEVDDSKRLTPTLREACAAQIRKRALCWSVAEIAPAEVDVLGPYRGALTAMARAIEALDLRPDYLLIDARPLPDVKIPQEAVVGGDGRHLAIGAASILAKVHRDEKMRELAASYPGYGFDSHMGYGTAAHLKALEALGPCAEHRRCCAPVRVAEGLQGRLFGAEAFTDRSARSSVPEAGDNARRSSGTGAGSAR
jgi:ribonuclease HII